jgi:hypothetical protein
VYRKPHLNEGRPEQVVLYDTEALDRSMEWRIFVQ